MWNFEERIANQLVELNQKYPNCKFIEIVADKDLGNILKWFKK